MNMQENVYHGYDIPMVMNSSPVEIINQIDTHSLQGFAGYIKHTILQSYTRFYLFFFSYTNMLSICLSDYIRFNCLTQHLLYK